MPVDPSVHLLLAWLAVFYVLVVLFWAKRDTFQRLGVEATPFALVVRKGASFDFAKRINPRIAKVLFTIGVFILAYVAFKFYASILALTLMRLSGVETPPAVTPIIPGVTVSLETFLVMLPALGAAVVAHEVAHGIAARIEGVPVKSTGLMLIMGVLPAAFVEPEEEAFKKLRLLPKLRVLSAGVLANYLLALLAINMLAMIGYHPVMVILSVEPGSPAEKAGLKPGDVILYVNGTRVDSIEELRRVINESRVVNVTVLRDGKHVSFLVEPRLVKGGAKMIGVIVGFRDPSLLHTLLRWLFFINWSLALINAAPLVITDGGKALTEVCMRAIGQPGKIVSAVLQAATILMLVVNVGIVRIG
ncbi:peptidase M50 [Pyrolobus fumarii 1A]|uniref:Peptidase M50 n=1 Tax=Pyrolobus fumarii (strain DSM 11204 / 1A) TaxID=694429 RepID=G0ECS6_PYRF1|nr:site-2 protease family protein [Pyrolobus fumarii]AEM39646.1 peptidase M50 [Pyrolobus fumarii 1A]